MAGLNFDPSNLVNGLNSFHSRFQAAVHMYADTSAIKLQNYARKNRRWTDRTGHARQRLTGYSGKYANGYRVYIAHGVSYGVYLEYAHEKKYAILDETVLKVGADDILPGFQRLLERMSSR